MAIRKCAYCEKEIDTKKESHYKFGKDDVCFNPDEATCITPYAWRNLVDYEEYNEM